MSKSTSTDPVEILQRLGWRAFKGNRRLDRRKASLTDAEAEAEAEVFERCRDLFEGACRWLAERIGESHEAVREALQTSDLYEERHARVLASIRSLAERGGCEKLFAKMMKEFSDVMEAAGIEMPVAAAVSAPRADTDADAEQTGIKRPTEKALIAWRLRDLQGINNQAEIARLMTEEGFPATQGQVSKWLRDVKEYLEAGNILPDLPVMSRPTSVDPKVIGMGERQDGRKPRPSDLRDNS